MIVESADEVAAAGADVQGEASRFTIRRPAVDFFQHYRCCAIDATSLRAGTAAKRAELLLEVIGIDESKWRVGKRLVFLAGDEVVDELDTLRELRITGDVVVLQKCFRMCSDRSRFQRSRCAACLIQEVHRGRSVARVIREAFVEVRSAAVFIQRYVRRKQRRLEFELVKPSSEWAYLGS